MWVSICCLISLCLPHLNNTLKNFSSLLTLTEFIHKRRKLSILLLFSSVPNFTCSTLTHKVIELKNTRFPKSNKNLTFFSGYHYLSVYSKYSWFINGESGGRKIRSTVIAGQKLPSFRNVTLVWIRQLERSIFLWNTHWQYKQIFLLL